MESGWFLNAMLKSQTHVLWKFLDLFSPLLYEKQVCIHSGPESKPHEIIVSFPFDSSCLWLMSSEWGAS